MTTVGQALIMGLAARGVEVVFGIPGVHTIELYRGLAGCGIRHVTARHEQGAGFMADGYARVSGKPGVALVITGPGLTNALTAMAQARADSVPVLVISGVNRRDSLGRGLGLLHELPDQAALVGALCPTFQISDPAAVGPTLSAVFAALTSLRPGPVHLEVPTDVMALPCPAPGTPGSAPPRPLADPAQLADAARRLASARHPLILAGGGARHAGAVLQALAERLDAPVVETSNARGLLHGHALVVPASPSMAAVRALIAASDQVLAVGTELGPTDYDMYGRGGLPDLAGMIRIDLCPAQLARHPAALTLQGDVGATLTALLPRLAPARHGAASRAATTRTAARAELTPNMQHQLA
ncbi:MAG: thiamine pyrophosphate-binding protein, partial [Pseudorhodobacter sp.]|nr:thiamine pyrophosphate-binding protein [Pseudorhodobacter sp.]